MNNTDNTVQHYTLRSLLELYNKVEIPILQRAYAQGRTTHEVNKLRKDFVTYLSEHLAKREAVALDFVYGAIREEGIKKIFIPLDGQQRLTTLWLLHWFLAAKEGTDRIKDISPILEKFVYETRPAAKSFCAHLLNDAIPSEKLREVKEYLSDREWFDETWHNDATVEGMLNMIKTFSQNEALLSTEVTLALLWDKNLISFYFLPIDKFGLTDELYIRMNARGEKLSDFEHFKSEFYKAIQGYPHIEEIKNKMEKEWVEYLWDYRKDAFTTDFPFLNYLSFVNEMQFYKNLKEEDKDDKGYPIKEKVPDSFLDLNFIADYYKDHNHVAFLEFALDMIPKLKEIRYEKLLPKQSFQDILTEMIAENKAETDDSIILYATLLYLKHHRDVKTDSPYLLEFIRVIRNLIVNTNDKGTREWNAILLTVERMVQEKDVYQALLNPDITIERFRSDPVNEERFKAALFAKNPQAKKVLYPMEDHENLLGDLTNLIMTAYGNNDNNIIFFDISQQDVTSLPLEFLENIYKAYDKIYQEDNKFTNIWGDLLLSSLYSKNEWRVWWETKNYKKARAIFYLASLYAKSQETNLEKFLIYYEKQAILRLKEHYHELKKTSVHKEQLFLLYVITRRIMNEDSSKFFKNGYNFGWFDKNGNYQSIFEPIGGGAPIVYQSYKSQFRYNNGIQDKATSAPELAPNAKRATFLDNLLKWAHTKP